MWRTGIVAVGAFLALSVANGFAAQSSDQEKKLPDMRQYRKWSLINEEPYYVPSSISYLCAAPPPLETRRRVAEERKQNPHVETYIQVYVNPVGEKAFRNPQETNFPVGTIIVKEKLPTKEAEKPELLTVMIKRKAGFDTKNGDWDYFVLNGNAGKVPLSTKKHCQECHQRVQKSGYVFRNYLPPPKENAPPRDN